LTTTTYTLGYVALTTTTQKSGPSDVAHIVNGSSTPSGARVGAANASAPTQRPASMRSVAALLPVVPARESAADGDGSSAAIITPTLKILRFGATTGTPDTCNIFFGILGTVPRKRESARQRSCIRPGGRSMHHAVNLLGSADLWRNAAGRAARGDQPGRRSGIDAFADGLQGIGRDHAESVAPFGPTLVGMADSARFFKGGTSAGPTP